MTFCYNYKVRLLGSPVSFYIFTFLISCLFIRLREIGFQLRRVMVR
jgi:hypothetical protein